MKFCSHLTNDINFLPDAIQPCCNTRDLGAIPQFPFTGGNVDMSAYGSHIEQIVATLQEKNSGMCAGCPELKSIEPQSAMEILFHTVSINKHYFCNCKCVYCKVVKEKTPDPYPIFPAIRGLHEQEMLHSRCSFHWGGGEPSILKEFEETSTWISGRGYPQYVHTSALRYSHAIALLLANNGGGG